MRGLLRDPARASKAAVLVVWTIGFAWLLSHGRFLAFLRPSLWPLLASGLAMVVLFLLPCLVAGRTGRTVSGSRRAALWMRMGILSLPLLCLAIGPRAVLDSYAFGKRSIGDLGGDLGQSRASSPEASAPAAATATANGPAGQAVTVLHLVEQADQWRGHRVTTDGVVYRGEDDLPKGYFVLFRFVITCCAADARPVGVLVKELKVGANADDSWVHVTGVATMEKVAGQERMVLHPDQIATIPQPDEPYLYPQ